eukprot:767418-Prymnesium_polylepis.2
MHPRASPRDCGPLNPCAQVGTHQGFCQVARPRPVLGHQAATARHQRRAGRVRRQPASAAAARGVRQAGARPPLRARAP